MGFRERHGDAVRQCVFTSSKMPVSGFQIDQELDLFAGIDPASDRVGRWSFIAAVSHDILMSDLVWADQSGARVNLMVEVSANGEYPERYPTSSTTVFNSDRGLAEEAVWRRRFLELPMWRPAQFDIPEFPFSSGLENPALQVRAAAIPLAIPAAPPPSHVQPAQAPSLWEISVSDFEDLLVQRQLRGKQRERLRTAFLAGPDAAAAGRLSSFERALLDGSARAGPQKRKTGDERLAQQLGTTAKAAKQIREARTPETLAAAYAAT